LGFSFLDMPFFVYLLQSEVDQSFYIGFSEDLQRRLEQHNAGLSTYTALKTPWKLVYFEQFDSKTEALKREKFLKRMRNRAFYERLIDNNKKL
jgi:putative endonuclease